MMSNYLSVPHMGFNVFTLYSVSVNMCGTYRHKSEKYTTKSNSKKQKRNADLAFFCLIEEKIVSGPNPKIQLTLKTDGAMVE